MSTHRNHSVSVPEFSVGGGPSAPKDRTVRSSFWTPKTETTMFLRSFQLLKADRPPPWTGRSAVHFGPPTEPKTVLFELIRDNGGPSAARSGPSAGLFPAEMYLGKTAITLSTDVQIWWSWTLWKAYSEGYTTQLNI